ncbi:MAG: winged helix-turn-helix transcriptional regulator [Sulfitobacter sp.]|nr:winged helix-turn-helix transcriptional regulator [Sulfitobacter sp.]
MPDSEFALETFLPYLLNQAAEASSLAFQQVYKDRYGMLRTEWRVLFHLGLYGSMTASEIGQRARMHKTKISRAVNRLSKRRFVERVRDDVDRRVEHLSLTVKGRAAYQDLRQTAERYEAQLLAPFTVKEVALLRQALGKLTNTPPDFFT